MFEHKHLPKEIQDFIATFPTESKIEIQDYERYENTKANIAMASGSK